MVVLYPKYDFEIQEFENSVPLKGTYRDLNGKELKEFDRKRKGLVELVTKAQVLEKSLKRVVERLEIANKKSDLVKAEALAEEQYALEDELTALTSGVDFEEKENDILKWKMSICIDGEDKDKIIALAESYGYLKLQKCIFEAVAEKKRQE